MLGGIGVWILILVGVLGLAVAAAAVLHFRFGLFRRKKAEGRGKSKLLEQSRVEVLESTPVDGERRLVLIRCDRIEHLILVGGPADVVVENDVKKLRGPGSPAPKPADADALLATAGLGTPVQRPERPAAAERRAAAAPRVEPPSGPRPVGRAPATNGGAPRVEAANERPPRPADTQPGRRDPQPPRAVQPAPLGTARAQPRREPQPAQRANGRRGDAAQGLPAAGVPWSEPDSLENEIVRALRFDPVPRGGDKAPAAQPAMPASDQKSASDSSATLGDLADRLEEALAQEVQSAGNGGQLQDDADEFAFDIPASKDNAASKPARTAQNRAAERAENKPAEEKQSRPARREPQRMPAAPVAAEPATAEPERERKRDQPTPADRREEAPVISLNARRREAADPLEDEMARLLGELTGDTKGR